MYAKQCMEDQTEDVMECKTTGWHMTLSDPRPIRDKSGLHPENEVCANHQTGKSKPPLQLRPIDFLPNFRLLIPIKHVVRPREGVHELSTIVSPTWRGEVGRIDC